MLTLTSPNVTDNRPLSSKNKTKTKWEMKMEEMIHKEPPTIDVGIRMIMRTVATPNIVKQAKAQQMLELLKEQFEKHTMYE